MILIYTKKKKKKEMFQIPRCGKTEVSAIAFVYIFISLVFMTQQRRGIEKESIRQNWTISCVVTHTNKVVVPYISMWVPTHFSLLCKLLVEACEVGPLTHPRCHFYPLVTITSKKYLHQSEEQDRNWVQFLSCKLPIGEYDIPSTPKAVLCTNIKN